MLTTEQVDKMIDQCLHMGKMVIRNGKPTVIGVTPPKTGWYGIHADEGCSGYWKAIINLPQVTVKNLIPLRCLSCYKVVARPETIHQCFLMVDIMEKLNLNSKIGVEPRDRVDADYGAYFYNTGLIQAKATEDLVRQTLEEAGIYIEVFTKRACTEFELHHGPSDTWQSFEGQAEVEAYITEKIAYERVDDGQTDWHKENVFGSWLVFAHGRRDYTYMEHNEGKRLYPEYIKY